MVIYRYKFLVLVNVFFSMLKCACHIINLIVQFTFDNIRVFFFFLQLEMLVFLVEEYKVEFNCTNKLSRDLT